MARYQNILETIGNTPLVRLNKLAPRRRQRLRQGRVLQPDGFGQGPHGARRHRGRRAQRRAEARPDRDRGDQRQHRHRPRDGVRAEGLSAGGHHGRELQRRAPQAAALPRREGGADARGREGQRHAGEGHRAGRRRTAGSCAASSRTRRMPTCTRAPRRARSSTTSPIERLDYFVTGFGTGGTLKGVARGLKARAAGHPHRRGRARQLAGARQRHSAGARRRRQPRRKPSAVSPAPHAGLGAGLHLDADRAGGGRRADRRDRAGGRQRCAAPGARARAAGRHLRRHLERRHARRGARRGAPRAARLATSSACCPTPASAICRRRCSKASAKR